MTDTAFDPAAAARWLAEAMETGSPLAPLPPELAPRDAAEGEEVAGATLEALGLVPCGLRLWLRGGGPPVAGPMLDARLLRSGTTVALPGLRHAQASAAVVGVLAEALAEEGDAPPVLAAMLPALDIASSRFGEAPDDPALLAADLGGLGVVVAGRRRAPATAPLRVALGPKGARPRGAEADLGVAFAAAAAAARRLGGLPAGALLVVAGLTPPIAPRGTLRASLGALGGAEAVFA